MGERTLIYQAGEETKSLTNITRKELMASDDASAVIQNAINQLDEAGGEVLIESGTYLLKTPIQLKSKATLRGCGRGTRLIVAKENKAGIALQGNKAHGGLVTDMYIGVAPDATSNTGIVLSGCGDFKITDCAIMGFEAYGIWVKEHSFLCDIRGCSLADNGKASIFLENLMRGEYGDFITNMIANCTIYGGGKGILCHKAIVVNIIGCQVYQTKDTAYHIREQSNSVLISGCRTFQIIGNAVIVENSDELNLSSNIFCWHTEHGIIIRRCRWGTITANEIIDSGSWNNDERTLTVPMTELPEDFEPFDGLRLINAHGFTVSSNTIFNWPVCPPMRYGIFEDESSFKNSFTSNNINYYESADIVANGRENLVKNNIGYAHAPHQDMRFPAYHVQTFDTRATQQFVDFLKGALHESNNLST